MMGKSSCFLITPKDYTSGRDRISKPTRGPFPHQWWKIKELEGKKIKQKKAPGKDVFMFTYMEKKIKVYSIEYRYLRKFIS